MYALGEYSLSLAPRMWVKTDLLGSAEADTGRLLSEHTETSCAAFGMPWPICMRKACPSPRAWLRDAPALPYLSDVVVSSGLSWLSGLIMLVCRHQDVLWP